MKHGSSQSWNRVVFAAIALVVAIATGCASSEEALGDGHGDPTTGGSSVLPGGSTGSKNGTSGDTSSQGAQGTNQNGSPSPQQPSPQQNGQQQPPPPPPVECFPIVNGTSQVKVNGNARLFNVQMPSNTSKMALMFVWHGWMQIPTTFANEVVYDPPQGKWRPFNPNAFPMPLMIVTPWDTKMIPPWGLDWDIAQGGNDFLFFEAMIQCINTQFTIDQKRIYSFGFSAGAVFTNLLAAKYPHLFAATISESGAWFNDSSQWSEVKVPIVAWKWPALDPNDGGAVLLTHGGPNDYATVISLENCATKAMPFLKAGGRNVTNCAHNFGHTLAPDLTEANYYAFMWAHQQGEPLPNGLTAGFPTPGHPVGATTCTFTAH